LWKDGYTTNVVRIAIYKRSKKYGHREKSVELDMDPLSRWDNVVDDVVAVDVHPLKL
jgi:hypothetical protein